MLEMSRALTRNPISKDLHDKVDHYLAADRDSLAAARRYNVCKKEYAKWFKGDFDDFLNEWLIIRKRSQ